MKNKRKTISKEFIIKGKGLHGGKDSFLILKPNFNPTGVVFINTDNGEKIILSPSAVCALERGTVIGEGGFKVSTVEHLLSALFAFDVDDVEIEIKGNEVPAMDGSAKFFGEMLDRILLIEKEEEADYFNLETPIEMESGGSYYKMEKSDCFKIECVYENNHPLIKRQVLELEINKENYLREIAPARTFGFDYEIEYLKKNNLALGGSLDNAVVLTKDSVMNKEGLRFKDEFVRHKILDLLGDLKVGGLRFKDIKITAVRPSHKANYDLVKLITARSVYGKTK